jgi:arsenite methyltransferase
MLGLGRCWVGLRRCFLNWGRDDDDEPDQVVQELGLQPGDRIAELGPGGGFFTFRLARAIGPEGVLYAVDTDQALLADTVERAANEGLVQVRPIVPAPEDASLPEPVALVFLSHVFHHLPDQTSYFRRLAGSLTVDGRVAIVETTRSRLVSRIFGHATAPTEIARAMRAAGYSLIARHDFLLPRQSFLVFRRPTLTAEPKAAAGSETSVAAGVDTAASSPSA